jgi:hypothetical protein
MSQTTIQAQGEYYPRRSRLSGRITLVRNSNRRQTMMDRLSTPFMRGVYSGGLVVGAIGGMAMMRRRAANERVINELKKGANFAAIEELDEFGYPCGNSFTSDRHKCYTDPKTGARLKKPITRVIYDKIMKSGGKAAQTLYKDREDRIRSSRRDGAKGWKKDKQQLPDSKPKFDKLILDSSARKLSAIFQEKGLEQRDSNLLSAEVIRMAAEKSSKNPKSPLVADDARDIKSLVRSGEQLAEELDKSDELEILLGKLQKKQATSKPQITLDKVETSTDREKFAAQQLADAKARGDKKDIKSWENAAKSTRKARVNESVAKTKQTQGTLFDTTIMDDSPLMRSIREKGNFGYACGSTFIPDDSKCYTDPKTRARLKVPLTKAQVEKVRSRSAGAEKLYSQQEETIKNRLRGSGSIPPEYLAAARSTGATKVLPSGIAEVDPKQLNLDPKRFQYKIVSGATGESGSLTDVKKWDSNIAGVQLAWHDPNDDKTYVINGHNRTNLAKKLGVETVTTRFIKAKDAKEARAIGAVTNVAEGSGTSLDAAKFFRDSGLKQEDLTKKGIPLKSAVASEGIALSKLNDGLFNKVIQGDLSKERGVIIGKNLSDHKEQSELVDLINKQEKKGKRITNEGISELTDMISNAPKKQEAGGLLGMLGFTPEARSLAVEKAEIQAHIKRQLSTDKKLFGTVGRGRNAAKLERGGNKIDSEQSSAISADADRALRVFDREKRYSGKTADAINSAALRIANGEKSAKVKDDVYREVLGLIK